MPRETKEKKAVTELPTEKEALNGEQEALPTTIDNDKVTAAKELKSAINSFILGHKLAERLKAAQIDLCLQTAMSLGLNPLKREIHFVPRDVWKKGADGRSYKTGDVDVNIIVGYEVYLKKAEATGRLNGWGTAFEKDGTDTKCIIKIYKKGWEMPFIHEVYLSEARQDRSPVWDKMPKFQLKKVAISQGFRLAFPEELGGMPYVPEEIGLGATDTNGNFIEERRPEALPAPSVNKIRSEQAERVMKLLDQKGKTLDDLKNALKQAFKIDELGGLNEKQAEVLLVKLGSLPDVEEIDLEEVDHGIEQQQLAREAKK